MRLSVPAGTYDAWFAKSRAVEMRAGKLVVRVDNVFTRQTLLQNYYSLISIAVKDAAGRRIEVDFIVDPAAVQDEGPESAIDGTGDVPSQNAARTRPALKESFTLDRFVVGPSNQIAYAAACAVAENPGRSNNPLFIYSDSGLGKTHLLHGIAHITNAQELRTHCITTEAYIREYVDAVRNSQRGEFQNKYEQADVLLVDDVQGLAEKEGTQEEFFNLFNALHMNDKQIVLTSDTHPRRMRGLMDRLVTRFEWGLVVEILKPELELRLAILRQKCKDSGLRVSDDVLRLLAQRATHNVRELEGVLNRVRMHADMDRSPISLDLALKALNGYRFDDVERAPPTVGEIINVTSEATGVSIESFTTKRKDQRAARARQLAMYLSREHTGLSYKEIGTYFGDRDHTTVLHGCNKITHEIEGDSSSGVSPKAETQRMISEIRTRLRV